MKILIIGAKGMLGQELAKVFEKKILFFGIEMKLTLPTRIRLNKK